MEFINNIFSVPLGYLMYFCYILSKNYVLAIFFFTLLTKILMFPLSLVAQKNSVKMVKMKPMLEEIQQRYEDNPQLMISEQKKLYKEEKYSAFSSIFPLLVQIPIIMGLIHVIYHPLQHLIHLDGTTIGLLSEQLTQATGETFLGSGAQLQMIHILQEGKLVFPELLSNQAMEQIFGLSFSFMGLDLSQIPTMASMAVMIPVLAGLSSLLLSVLQNQHNVLQREQGFWGQWGMALFLVAFSVYFAFVVPAGIGVYWIIGNLLSIGVMFLCNKLYDPNKYIDYANRSVKPKLTREEKKAKRAEKKVAHAREKADAKRFYAQPKQLVFYSESNGFYKYFSGIIDYLLKNSQLDIHYVTSDPNDRIFQNENQRIHAYYIGGTQLISFMMRMDADMVIMTMPDLEQYHIKRSLVRKDVEYIYLDHGMTSLHLMLREHALDAFDTIFCYGPNQVEEVRETEKVYQLPEKRVVKTGYPLLDELLEKVGQLPAAENQIKQILIGPSWQTDSLMDYCLDPLLAQLLQRGHKIILRPHPEYVKRFPSKMEAISKRYEKELGEYFIIETDFSSNETVYTSDVMITDWSSIAQEFSYTTKRPSIFINTPMKIMNPNYQNIPCVPLDISLRDEIGVSVDVDKLDGLPEIVEDMLAHAEKYKEQIIKVMDENLYHVGESAQMCGEYIMERLTKKTESDGC